jgi:hypothetical protein
LQLKLVSSSVLFSASTPGDLINYLQTNDPTDFAGLAGTSPPNPFSAYSSPDAMLTPPVTVTSYFVFVVNAGNFTGLLGPSDPTVDNFNVDLPGLGKTLPRGTDITAFLYGDTGKDTTPYWVSTAQSGQLQVTTTAAGVPGPTAGAGLPGILAGLGLIGFAANRRRRKLMACRQAQV